MYMHVVTKWKLHVFKQALQMCNTLLTRQPTWGFGRVTSVTSTPLCTSTPSHPPSTLVNPPSTTSSSTLHPITSSPPPLLLPR